MSTAVIAKPPLPAYGTIRGGRFNGWSYSYLAMLRHPSRPTLVRLRATPPGWPFPQTVDLVYPQAGVTFVGPTGAATRR